MMQTSATCRTASTTDTDSTMTDEGKRPCNNRSVIW